MAMLKLWAALLKEARLLLRDRVGLALMFLMPVVLVLVITRVQNSTFELVNDNQITLLLVNADSGQVAREFIDGVQRLGMFRVAAAAPRQGQNADFSTLLKENDALVALIIPREFSGQMQEKTAAVTAKALANFGLETDTTARAPVLDSLELVFHPVLQKSYRYSITGALQSVLLAVENKQMIRSLYETLNQAEMPPGFEEELAGQKMAFAERFARIGGGQVVPNATQHNVPAWTIFAMFFMVISLGSNIVREKLGGSFIRLKTLPTNYLTGLVAKQIVYLGVVLLQVLVIFSLGTYLFPMMGLPALNIPDDLFSLFLVTVLCGWCAISYAMCVGVFAGTQEQANGFGAVSVVLLAAIGGIFVPSFAMPQSFQLLMNLSPLHWCLESYYGLFLQGGNFTNLGANLVPLLAVSLGFQLLVFIGLKRKNLI